MTNGVFRDDTNPPNAFFTKYRKKMTNGVFRDDTNPPNAFFTFETTHFVRYNA